jgi:hypothetical protein
MLATDIPLAGGRSIQYLEARHRAHARVEDRIHAGKDTGFGRFPSRRFSINQVWLELALTGIDLIAWTQMLLLDGEMATAEPKKRRYRLLHTLCPYRAHRTANAVTHQRLLALGQTSGPSLPADATPARACICSTGLRIRRWRYTGRLLPRLVPAIP